MSMRPKPIGLVPENTAHVARAAFLKGNVYMQMRNVLGSIYEDEDFSELFKVRGRPAIAPWRLALVTVMQLSEGLSDRQAAEAARRIESPYETEARYSTKRSMGWVGYKVHLTESCDEGFPHLIIDVHPTAATATDVKQLTAIQDRLAASGALPAQLMADSSYVCGSNLVSSHLRQVDLIGPAYKDNTWQAKAGEGFDVANFRIDWERKTVTCPQERRSIRWSKTKTARGRTMIHIDFPPDHCSACPSRSLCTRAKDLPRTLTLQPQEEHEAIQSARRRQKTEEFASLYSDRAGIEGTFSQGVRAFGLRKARYRGLQKTHLQELATAASINVGRITNGLKAVPTAATRRSRLTALAPAS